MLCFSMPLAIAAGPSPFRDGGAADPPAREKLLGCRDEYLPALRRDPLSPGREFGSRSHSLNVAEIAGRRRPRLFAREREREIQLDAAQRRRHISLKDRPDGTANLCICHLPPSDQRRPTSTESSVANAAARLRRIGGVRCGRRRCGRPLLAARQTVQALIALRRCNLRRRSAHEFPLATSNSPSTENLKCPATMEQELKT
jgi:hypothetical protein